MQVTSKLRDMGVSASRSKWIIDFVRKEEAARKQRGLGPGDELLIWNQAKVWDSLAPLFKEEADSLADIARSTVKIASGGTRHSMGKGSRVVVQGLKSSPEMNGRTGVICGEMSPQNARVTVQIDADGARPSVLGTFSPENLRVLKHNPSVEWLDEDGLICPKNVDFSRECAKGHALVSFGADGLNCSPQTLICRVCHIVAVGDLGAWLVCSVAGCCGGYAVCSSCVLACATPGLVTPPASDEFCMQV